MKRLVGILCCIVLVAALVATAVGCQNVPRSEKLKLYVPGEYIDEDIFEVFETWYLEQTGERVVVEVETFEAVEDIQMAVETYKADYDLLCPSDYMIQYLREKGLLREVDKKVIDITADDLIHLDYLQTSREFDPDLAYSVPYMYGTLGLVYDMRKTGGAINSWEALYGSQFAGKRSVKDSIRDAYVSACLYNAKDSLKGLSGTQQKQAVQAIFLDATQPTVDAAGALLKSIKSGTVWDADYVKFEMAANSTQVAVALMWSCDAGYVMNDYEDANGKQQKGNHNLWYVVPEEGGNVYIDSFVINKYAVNVKAANYFLKFLCQKDIAVQNSEYAGAISPVKAAYDELYNYYVKDEDGIFSQKDIESGWKDMFIETMFPSTETLNRCGVMKDFGADRARVSEMWANLQ